MSMKNDIYRYDDNSPPPELTDSELFAIVCERCESALCIIPGHAHEIVKRTRADYVVVHDSLKKLGATLMARVDHQRITPRDRDAADKAGITPESKVYERIPE